MKVCGIDVSRWQGDINWTKVKAAGIGFVMIRAAAGTQEDACFQKNAKGAAEAGIPMGAYLYSLAVTEAQAQAEADFLLKLTSGYKFSYPLAYDIEDASQEKLTNEQRTALVEAFCGRIEAAGCYAMLYSSKYWLETRFVPERIARYDQWVAQWGNLNTYQGKYGMWQYSNTGRVDGISSNVDLDFAYKDYPALTASSISRGGGKWVGSGTMAMSKTNGSKLTGAGIGLNLPASWRQGCRQINGKWYYLSEMTAGPLKEGQCIYTNSNGELL